MVKKDLEYQMALIHLACFSQYFKKGEFNLGMYFSSIDKFLMEHKIPYPKYIEIRENYRDQHLISPCDYDQKRQELLSSYKIPTYEENLT